MRDRFGICRSVITCQVGNLGWIPMRLSVPMNVPKENPWSSRQGMRPTRSAGVLRGPRHMPVRHRGCAASSSRLIWPIEFTVGCERPWLANKQKRDRLLCPPEVEPVGDGSERRDRPFVDQCYTSEELQEAAREYGIWPATKLSSWPEASAHFRQPL